MNRSAVALAADSAATVKYWHQGELETRYFKGANKIFNLSASQPVGIMIYAAAELQGAPWETLIKSYREQLSARSHDQLIEYANDFFSYIVNNAQIFPAEVQERQFISDVEAAAGRIVFPIPQSEKFKAAKDEIEKQAVFREIVAENRAKIVADQFLGNCVEADSVAAVAKYLGVIEKHFRENSWFRNAGWIDFAALSEAAILSLFKFRSTVLSASGLVIAGFGAKEFFPKLLSYRCYGLLLGKLVVAHDEQTSAEINQSNGSAIVPFAQDEMIRTFVYGVGASGLTELDNIYRSTSGDLVLELQKNGLASDVSGDPTQSKRLQELKTQAIEAFQQKVMGYFFESHTVPLRRVVGMLPIDELAELAETLVSIESLKERVTRPSTSVGGPIDVAVISKNDGFIWIKRKHYFDPKLNPRFFSRRSIATNA